MRLEALDLNLLVCLGHLLDEASVSKAAVRMSVTQPTMSHRLSQLRELFDDPLLIRQGRSMALSPLARELQPQVASALAAARSLLERSGAFDPATAEGTINVLGADYEWTVGMQPVIARLRAAAPGLRVRCHTPKLDALDRLADGRLDFMVMPRMDSLSQLPDEVYEKQSALGQSVLIEDEWLAVVREDHPNANELDLDAIVRLDHVMLSAFGGSRAELDRVLDRDGLRRTVAVTVPNFHVIWRVVCATDLVGMLPKRFAAQLPGLHTVPHPAKLEPIRLCLWWHPRSMGSPRLEWFRDFVLETFGADPSAAH